MGYHRGNKILGCSYWNNCLTCELTCFLSLPPVPRARGWRRLSPGEKSVTEINQLIRKGELRGGPDRFWIKEEET